MHEQAAAGVYGSSHDSPREYSPTHRSVLRGDGSVHHLRPVIRSSSVAVGDAGVVRDLLWHPRRKDDDAASSLTKQSYVEFFREVFNGYCFSTVAASIGLPGRPQLHTAERRRTGCIPWIFQYQFPGFVCRLAMVGDLQG